MHGEEKQHIRDAYDSMSDEQRSAIHYVVDSKEPEEPSWREQWREASYHPLFGLALLLWMCFGVLTMLGLGATIALLIEGEWAEGYLMFMCTFVWFCIWVVPIMISEHKIKMDKKRRF